MSYSLEGYVDVAQRIRQLRAKHPEAVLRPADPAQPFRIVDIGGRDFIVYTAACYRSPDDQMPAIACAAEPVLGRTNFTKDSEVMNAETSAWGRAIMAALAVDEPHIASANEVMNRQMDRSSDAHPAKGRAALGSKAKAVRPARNCPVCFMLHLSGCGLSGGCCCSRCNCRGRFPDGQDIPGRLRWCGRRIVCIGGSGSRLVRSQVYLEVVADEDDDWNVGQCRSCWFWLVGFADLMGEEESCWDETDQSPHGLNPFAMTFSRSSMESSFTSVSWM